jgi:hypothetical protein
MVGGGMALRPLSDYTIPDDYLARFFGTPFSEDEPAGASAL